MRLRLLAALATVGITVFAAPAWAGVPKTISINPGNVPTTAVAKGPSDCDAKYGGGPLVGKDIWVFNLANAAGGDKGDFLSVTATFGTITKSAPADGGITFNGTSKAWIITNAGLTLTGATATIDGDEEFFVLTHTCYSNATPSSAVSNHPNDPSNNPSDPTLTSGGGLPRTGDNITGLAGIGLAAIAGGTGMLFYLRRKRAALNAP